MLCQSLAKRAGRVDSFLVDGRALRARPSSTSCNASAKAAEFGARRQISVPRGAAHPPPLGRRPPFLSRLHKSAASPHLRRVLRQYELVEKVRSYDPDADEGLINRAYVFSMKAHGSQMRASGDPYFSHPIEVAGILTDLKLDDQTIVTAILHDTIEDTLATPEEIDKLFGPDVARLVDGVTKLSKIEAQSENERAAENLRKFLLALSDDIRVLLVKLADRLHNMRTLHHIPSEDKRRRIARETMDIYAPLAERIGMYEMMNEMQTLAFKEIEPDAYASITRRLTQLHEQGGDLVNRIGLGLQLYLADNGLEAEVIGRQKHPFSIWKKMAERHISFEQLSDVMAFRIIVADVAECYRALGLIHHRWPMVPGRFKDYISTPKRNGYRILHTSVIHDSKMRIEIQIRDKAMHEQAERGLAAHWAYKEGKPEADIHVPWVDDLMEILEHAESPEELLEHTRMAMYQDRIFAFTPKGELIQLPKGATPVDFAYAVHTDLGDRTVGRQGQWPGDPPEDHAREWRPGRNPRLGSAAPAAELAAFRRDRQGAGRRPPLRPPQGARGDGRARTQDLRRDRRAASRRARQGCAQARAQEAQDREPGRADDRDRAQTGQR